MTETLDDFFRSKVMQLSAATYAVKCCYDKAREIVSDEQVRGYDIKFDGPSLEKAAEDLEAIS